MLPQDIEKNYDKDRLKLREENTRKKLKALSMGYEYVLNEGWYNNKGEFLCRNGSKLNFNITESNYANWRKHKEDNIFKSQN
jgi:hypothetical protein